MTVVELVRHARAGSRDRWWGRPDRDRPLTDEGMAQARALAERLAGDDVLALYSSPYVRCVQSLEPLADALGMPIVEDDALGEAVSVAVSDGGDGWVTPAWLGARGLAFLDRVVAAHPGGRVVACSHGDVIPATVAALVGRDSLGLSDVRCKKGGWFTLAFDAGRCVGAEPHGPPVVDHG